jgi:uncharacterized Zn finger protein (UPF0148 family)
MQQQSILDHNSTPPAVGGDMPGASASRSATASVSAGIAAANLLLTLSSEKSPRFPGEDGGRSLTDMAHGDLDATLQLLADRAQYITGASGAAIALRRGEHTDMLCRASAGSNAPELGARLSMEYGLSGESVRTVRALRCDDTENDPRVNREGCRELGIASVVVMPIVSEEQVLGVFELFSGKVRAFDDRDLSALQRLGEMVETAVKHAVAAHTIPFGGEFAPAEGQPPADVIAGEARQPESPTRAMISESLPVVAVREIPPQKEQRDEPVPKKPLLWSAAIRTQGSTGTLDEKGAAESIAVPAGLRRLQKCQACGFPVSQGRTFCVECEEKQWRGQRLSQAAAAGANQGPREEARLEPVQTSSVRTLATSSSNTPAHVGEVDSALAGSATALAVAAPVQDLTSGLVATATAATQTSSLSSHAPADASTPNDSAPFLSSAVQSPSWFAANKYIFGVLLVVAIGIGAIVWLH